MPAHRPVVNGLLDHTRSQGVRLSLNALNPRVRRAQNLGETGQNAASAGARAGLDAPYRELSSWHCPPRSGARESAEVPCQYGRIALASGDAVAGVQQGLQHRHQLPSRHRPPCPVAPKPRDRPRARLSTLRQTANQGGDVGGGDSGVGGINANEFLPARLHLQAIRVIPHQSAMNPNHQSKSQGHGSIACSCSLRFFSISDQHSSRV